MLLFLWLKKLKLHHDTSLIEKKRKKKCFKFELVWTLLKQVSHFSHKATSTKSSNIINSDARLKRKGVRKRIIVNMVWIFWFAFFCKLYYLEIEIKIIDDNPLSIVSKNRRNNNRLKLQFKCKINDFNLI